MKSEMRKIRAKPPLKICGHLVQSVSSVCQLNSRLYDNGKSGFCQNISPSQGNAELSPEKRLTVPAETVKCLLPKYLTIPRETVKRCRANS